jgi:hypothetical protein
MAPSAGRVLTGTAGRAGGSLLAAAFGLTALLRGTRALHPVGVCGVGRFSSDPGPASGIPLLDDPGPHPCTVRWSRAVGRARGRDIEGLALCLTGRGAGDLLLASTGTGVLGRHLLVARPPHEHGFVSTLLPLQSARGSLLLGLEPVAPGEPDVTGGAAGAAGPAPVSLPTAYRLLVSAPGHPWHVRGRLQVAWADRDCPRRHDPVGHSPVGTWTHPFWARLRDPAYDVSRRVRAREAGRGAG